MTGKKKKKEKEKHDDCSRNSGEGRGYIFERNITLGLRTNIVEAGRRGDKQKGAPVLNKKVRRL